MKKILILIGIFCALKTNAQDYFISFAGAGASTTVSTVKVENVALGTSIIMSGSDILHLTAITTGINSQKGFELSGGIGYPERLGLKLKYGGTFQIGASVGWIPGGFSWLPDYVRGESTSVAVDLYFHFTRSKKNNLLKWYLNGGLSKFFPETSDDETINYILYTKLGRSFNFEHKTGINLDCGFLLINYSGTTYYSPLYTARYGHPVVKNSFTRFYPCPSFDLSFFVKF